MSDISIQVSFLICWEKLQITLRNTIVFGLWSGCSYGDGGGDWSLTGMKLYCTYFLYACNFPLKAHKHQAVHSSSSMPNLLSQIANKHCLVYNYSLALCHCICLLWVALMKPRYLLSSDRYFFKLYCSALRNISFCAFNI